MMLYNVRTFSEPLTDDYLCQLFRFLFLNSDKKYRTNLEPMQIVSGNLAIPKIHYETTPANSIKINGNLHKLV